MAVSIRRATIDDAAAIADVHVASWRWAYRDDLPTSILDGQSTDARAATWRSAFDEVPSDCIFVAERDRTVVGFVSVGAPESDADSAVGEVHAIYLRQEVAGTGIGSDLLRTGVDALRTLGYKRAFLWVFSSNTRARRFYEREGWSSDETTNTYELGGELYRIVRYSIEL